MTDKQIIIDDQTKTIHRLQQECTEKTNIIIALGNKLKAKEQECEELKEYIKHLHNLCGNETDNQYEYKQTLQEIKEIATCCIEGDVARIRMKQILNKISECEVSNG